MIVRTETPLVMVGNVMATDQNPFRAHCVAPGAATRTTWAGVPAWYAICGAVCVPGHDWYLATLETCPKCAQQARGFRARLKAV